VELMIAKTRKLDITDAISFMGLLMCKKELARMDAGSILEVSLDDVEFMGDLVQLVERSTDTIVDRHRSGGIVKISIRKG
jgi:TusA-related sulfurtransferase